MRIFILASEGCVPNPYVAVTTVSEKDKITAVIIVTLLGSSPQTLYWVDHDFFIKNIIVAYFCFCGSLDVAATL